MFLDQLIIRFLPSDYGLASERRYLTSCQTNPRSTVLSNQACLARKLLVLTGSAR